MHCNAPSYNRYPIVNMPGRCSLGCGSSNQKLDRNPRTASHFFQISLFSFFCTLNISATWNSVMENELHLYSRYAPSCHSAQVTYTCAPAEQSRQTSESGNPNLFCQIEVCSEVTVGNCFPRVMDCEHGRWLSSEWSIARFRKPTVFRIERETRQTWSKFQE